jgi:hypothetical protein
MAKLPSINGGELVEGKRMTLVGKPLNLSADYSLAFEVPDG